MVGRERELTIVRELLDGARRSDSGSLIVRGEAGIGKTALLAAAEAEARGEFLVLRAVGFESEGELVYAGLHQLLHPLLGELSTLPERQAAALASAFAFSPEEGADRMVVGLSALTLVAAAAEEQPVLLLVDDAQWLDGESLAALSFVARRLAAERVAAMIAVRDGTGRTVSIGGVAEVRLEQLDVSLSQRLVRDRFEELGEQEAEAVVRVAAGNPLALLELAGIAASGGGQLVSVEQSYLARVRSLPEQTQELMLLAASDDEARLELLAEALGNELEAADALEPAELEQLVSVIEGTVRFKHPLVRSAVYRGATFAHRRRAHLALAAALSGAEDADRRAWHLAASAVGPDEDTAAALERSANRALRRSGYAAASAALECAARLSPDPHATARRLAAAAETGRLAGQPDRAVKLLAEADIPDSDVSLAVEIARVRGAIEAQNGSPRTAMRIFLDAASAILPLDRGAALELITRAQESAGLAGAVEEAVEFGKLTESYGEGDTPEERIMIGLTRGFTAMLSNDPSAAVPWLTQAAAAAPTIDDPRLLTWAGTAAMFLGDEEGVREILGRAVAEARAQGVIWALPFALHLLAGGERRTGNIAGAEADAEESLLLAREMGQDVVAAGALSTLTAIAAFRGEIDRAYELAQQTRELAGPRGLAVQLAGVTRALTELELSRGRGEEALAEVEPMMRGRGGHKAASEPFALFTTPAYVEAAARAGGVNDRVRDQLEAFETWIDAGDLSWGRAIAARCRALIAADEDEADRLYATALQLHDAHPQLFETARTSLLYGEFLRRGKRKTDARLLLRQATETFESLGARLWAERATAELRATGATARRRTDAARGELTPQELQIVRLVAGGRTNPEVAAQLFLSPKTVQYHLRKVFGKLGIASRTELVRLVAEGSIAGATEARGAA